MSESGRSTWLRKSWIGSRVPLDFYVQQIKQNVMRTSFRFLCKAILILLVCSQYLVKQFWNVAYSKVAKPEGHFAIHKKVAAM